MKRIIKLFCVVSCLLVCFTGCGKKDEGLNYNAEQLREYMEAQIGYVGNIIENSATDQEYVTADDVLKSASKSWSGLENECGHFILNDSVSDFKIEEVNGELSVTECLKFENRDVNVSSTFKIVDDKMTMTSLSFEPVYSMGEKMKRAAMNTAMGMGTVFCVLIFIYFIISLFKYIPQITAAFEKKKGTDTSVNHSTVAEETSAEDVVTDDTELIAVIAAAIAASEHTTTDSFVVRSIRKR